MPTINTDEEHLSKLRKISEASHFTQTQIIEDFIDAVFSLLGTIDSERVSMGSIANVKRHCVETPIFPMFVGTLPSETKDKDIEKEVVKKIKSMKKEKRIEKK